MKGFGIFLLVLYPGAFVDIATDQLLSLSPWQQLRIFCAGVWHNFVIVVVALSVLVSLPTLLTPIYVTGHSVLVTALTEVFHIKPYMQWLNYSKVGGGTSHFLPSPPSS